MIPKQLQKTEFRFCLIRRQSKVPFENAWQKNGYVFNDPKLLQHIKEGGNYGVIGGYGNLRMLDIDDLNKVEEFKEKLGDTFTIKTGSGGLHFYFISEYNINNVLANGLGEFRANNYQCVAPGSTHPNGKQYEVIGDNKIIEFPKEMMVSFLKPFLKDSTSYKTNLTDKESDTSRSAKEMSAIIKLIKKEIPREKVYEEMNMFAKWSGGSEGYKNKTYNKAFDWVEEKKKDKKKKKKEKDEKKFMNRYVDEENKIIIEQVYDIKTNKSQFCVYNFNTDEVRYVDYWEHNGLKYFSKEGEELEKGAVLLPSKAEDYDEEELDKEIKNFITSWLNVPEQVIKFGIWNTKRSWVYDKFHSLNYLRALGDTGLGKSRYLNTFGSIHYTPIFTTGSTTPAPLFRILDKWGGTLVMDEADLKKSDESEDIIKIINQGFEKGNFIMRCDQSDANKISFFDPYSPKILATRRSFQDKATESRCITHVMTTTKIKNIPVNLNKEFYNQALILRNKLLMWRFRNYFKIDLNKKYDIKGLEPRVQQIVSSYISLFGDNEKAMGDFVKYIKSYQLDLIEERQSSFEGLIVGVIHKLLEKKIIDFSSKDIIEEGGFTTGKNDKPMQPRALNSYLKSLGFKKTIPKKVNEKTKRCIPLDAEMLKDLFKRYGYGVTVVTVVTEISQNDKREEKEQKELKVTVGSASHKDSNLRNSVTDNEDKIEEVKI